MNQITNASQDTFELPGLTFVFLPEEHLYFQRNWIKIIWTLGTNFENEQW